ncbi:MAG: tryptophan synthase subunit alpha [Bdellovibrionales bacterium]
MSKPNRLEKRFELLRAEGKKALITYATAGYPSLEAYAELLNGLPKAGADIIEVGVPFSDPMADGPIIQAADVRALEIGTTLPKILEMVAAFREQDQDTPILLMGYYNPIYSYGIMRFLDDAAKAGVDGFIIPDLPPEEDAEFRVPAKARDLSFIRFVTPTTDAARLAVITKDAAGFLYCVSVAGITGGASADPSALAKFVEGIRPATDLPVAIGFGVSSPEQARATADAADGVIVGSAIIKRITASLDEKGEPGADMVKDVLGFVKSLADAVHA